MATQKSLEFRFSGTGTSNPVDSQGGAVSSYAMQNQQASGFAGISGVTFVDSYGSDGAANLAFNFAAKSLTYTPPGEVAASAVVVSAGGRFALPGKYAYLLVDVTASALPAEDASFNFSLSAIPESLFQNANTQTVDYCCLYAFAVDACAGVMLSVTQPAAGGLIEFGAEPAGKNQLSTSSGSVNFGVTDVSLGNLAAGDYYAFWLRRTISTVRGDESASGKLSASFS